MQRLYLIVDGQRSFAVAPALAALPRGTAAVQLRDARLSAAALLQLARELLRICRAAGAPLLINDRADVALACGADGVQLPARGLAPADARALLGASAIVGASCHASGEIARAAAGGADFCVFGPVWETPGKGPAKGTAGLADAVRSARVPVLAIGGVDARTAPLALAAGAAGVACIRGVFGAEDPAAAASALWRSIATAGPARP